MTVEFLQGDVIEILKTLPNDYVDCIATNWIVAYCTYNNKKPGSCDAYMNSHEYEKEVK
jgi:hypothetical protein